MEPASRIEFWCEWKSWALPIKVAAFGDFTLLEVQIGPFGFTLSH